MGAVAVARIWSRSANFDELSIFIDSLIHALDNSIQMKNEVSWSFRWQSSRLRQCRGSGKKVNIERSQLLLEDKANKSGIALKYGPVDGGLWASISGSIINLLCYWGERLISAGRRETRWCRGGRRAWWCHAVREAGGRNLVFCNLI